MEHSEIYVEIKQEIENGKYKRDVKRLAKKLMKLKNSGYITQEEHNELLVLSVQVKTKSE